MRSFDTLGFTVRSAVLLSLSFVCAVLISCSTARTPAPSMSTGTTSGTPASSRLRQPAPGTILLEALEGHIDTVEFHIGAPLFLRLSVGDARGCAPGVGELFHFDATGSQLGWSFEEVSDSLLFPRLPGRCDRVIMLSSEASNRLAEGRFTMRTELFLEPRERIISNLIALHPVRSQSGANERSYARFLQEQIVRNPAHLRDPQTLAALFGEGVPTSAESEVYRSLILFRSGDLAGARQALHTASQMAAERGRPLDVAAATTHAAVTQDLAAVLPDR